MQIKLKSFDQLKDVVIPSIINDNDGELIFILLHKDGLLGSIYPMMIKYLGKELEVEEDINPDTFIFKEWIDNSENYYEIKIREWMIN